MSIGIDACLDSLVEVITNRPKPLRDFDQIYMKPSDLLRQAEEISRGFHKKSVLFVGDGDAIGLCVVHLSAQGLLGGLPEHFTVLDFDERVVNSINDSGSEGGTET